MKILNLKYKMHKFVNMIFYLFIFIFGFVVGFTTNKIDISKIITQFLFIDNVQAYTITKPSEDNIPIDEEYIYNLFSTNENFNINEFKYIYCSYDGSASSSQYLRCYAFKSIKDFKKLKYVSYDSYYKLNYVEEFEHYQIYIRIQKYKTILEEYVYYNNMVLNSSSITSSTSNSTYEKVITNFDIIEYGDGSNLLDFSSYIKQEDIIQVKPLTSDNLFYNISKNIVGELEKENLWIYDLITMVLIISAFLLLIIPISKVFKYLIGGGL